MSPKPPNLQELYSRNPKRDDPAQQPRSLARRIMSLPDGSLIGAFVLFLVLVWVCCPVPNGAPGMDRAKTFRALSEMRDLARALELYRNDLGAYPASLSSLTSPTAYIDQLRTDPWSDTRSSPYRYHTSGTSFIIGSFGPDRDEKTGGDLPWSDADAMNALLADETRLVPFTYDGTNGTFSEGDLWRIGGKAGGESSP